MNDFLLVLLGQYRPRQIKRNLTHTPDPNDPQRFKPPPAPVDIHRRKIRLHSNQKRAFLVQDINAAARGGEEIAVSGNFDAVGDPLLAEIDGPFVGDGVAAWEHVEGVDRVRAGGVEVHVSEHSVLLDNLRRDCARVGYLHGFLVGGECDAVWLLHGVFDDTYGSGTWAEAIRGTTQYWSVFVYAVAPAIF